MGAVVSVFVFHREVESDAFHGFCVIAIPNGEGAFKGFASHDQMLLKFHNNLHANGVRRCNDRVVVDNGRATSSTATAVARSATATASNTSTYCR